MELSSNPGVPRKFPGLPRKFLKLPRKFPDFPGGQPLSLGSLTPSPDSQKLSLNSAENGNEKQKNFVREEPSEPKTGTAGTGSCTNRNRTEPGPRAVKVQQIVL